MVDRYSSECTELCHFPNNNGDWVKYSDYEALERKLAALVVASRAALELIEALLGDGMTQESEPYEVSNLKAAIAAAEGKEEK